MRRREMKNKKLYDWLMANYIAAKNRLGNTRVHRCECYDSGYYHAMIDVITELGELRIIEG